MDKIIASQPLESRFRSQTSSHVENKKVDNNLHDILNLVNMNNAIERSLSETKEIIHIEKIHNNINNQILEDKIDRLENELKQYLSGSSMKIKTVYPHECHIEDKEELAANIDVDNGCITLPFSYSGSKMVIEDELNERTFIPDGLKIKTRVLNTSGIIGFNENDPYEMVKEGEHYYYCKVVGAKTTTFVDVEIHIELPDTIISNRDINTVVINPFPFKTMELIRAEYKLFSDYVQIPSLSSHRHSEVISGGGVKVTVVKDMPNIMLNFKEITAKELRFVFRQRKFFEEKDLNVFYVGMKNLKVLNRRYDKNIGVFYSEIEFPNKALNTIYDVKTILNNEKEIQESSIQYEFFKVDELGIPSRVPESFPFSVNNGKLLIKTNLYKTNITPSISEIQIFYKD